MSDIWVWLEYVLLGVRYVGLPEIYGVGWDCVGLGVRYVGLAGIYVVWCQMCPMSGVGVRYLGQVGCMRYNRLG